MKSGTKTRIREEGKSESKAKTIRPRGQEFKPKVKRAKNYR